ncbi:polysaccharide lyase family 8 protein [Serpula lacrymans var. lacrymans S7.9]|uniref:Polysaccharide lyase family 8 protein n=1 Tax=Serpula lacrymans var. lacrymans (strain S7.9) TaxID=578457 RepID=F8PA48_SERL9|nr:polysaccharide lyase family 8 protein [Serpula lacrymans var. lacrymans S7.9]EGO20045.1 polysaccharide lyase family 8 protein [Serpula lacrymans var. lacrymans S7.9]
MLKCIRSDNAARNALSLANTETSSDLQTIMARRLSTIVSQTSGGSSISTWLSSLEKGGQWPDINYTAGCNAQAANWPAQGHWSRIVTFAAAWHGGLKDASQYAQNSSLRTAISSAMGYWFSHDFTNPACLDSGGTSTCPCGTPGLWNTNWFSNIIGIPGYVGETCLLLGGSLTETEVANCTRFTGRAYGTFQTGIRGMSAITGSNTLDIASIGVDEGLLLSNTTLVSSAYQRINNEVEIQTVAKSDGIKSDGGFFQHTLLYNGNYGKDYANDVFGLAIEAGGTQFQASNSSIAAFTDLLSGSQWMIFRNTLTNVLHWDFLQLLGEEWQSDELQQVYTNLIVNTSDANSGALQGNRMFYSSDYMVQRGGGYVTTLKMKAKRIGNSECVNAQSPYGFHLSDGTVYNYLQGNEYEDIAAAWDWNLIPGITVDYGATTLGCSTTKRTGDQSLVGGASDGNIGVAAMRYENPLTKSLNWRKTWFFLDNDVQYVMVAQITSTTQAPVFSVLDQRKLNGQVYVESSTTKGVVGGSGNFTQVSSLWHGGMGYSFDSSNAATKLSLSVGPRSGSWSSIGISKQPSSTVDLFAAWLYHDNISAPVSYAVYPATTYSGFQQKAQSSNLRSLRNDGVMSALLDVTHHVVMIVFWETNGGKVVVPAVNGTASLTVTSNGTANVIIHTDSWSVTASDPTQLLSRLTLGFTLGSGAIPAGWGSSQAKSWTVELPSGADAGSSVTLSLA